MLKIDVKYVQGHWEFIGGGGIPVKEGAIGELRVSKSMIYDPDFLSNFTVKTKIKILEEGTPLYIAMRPNYQDEIPVEIKNILLPISYVPHSITTSINQASELVPVVLGKPTEWQQKKGEKSGGLWLHMEGMSPKGITSSSIEFPKLTQFQNKVAYSLNHAYTILSEIYETDRISHTGNIYEHVFFQESNGSLCPLKDLRNEAMANAENTIINQLWAKIEKVFGRS
jgi:hypothetical protein